MEKHILLRLLLVLCFVCVVFANIQREKRDIHRIILKERRPRSHRSHRHHKHHYQDLSSRGKREKHYGKYHDFSLEDLSKYQDSRENSYEDTRYKSHRHRKPSKSIRTHYSSSEYEDFKPEHHRGEWIPLFSGESHSSDFYEGHSLRRRPRKDNNRYSSPMDIDLTTKYPTTTSFYSYYTELPTSSGFSHKNIDLNQPNPSFKKGHRYNGSYEVRENQRDYEDFQDHSFQVLAPTLELTNKDLTAEANNVNKEGSREDSVRKMSARKRGRRIKIINQ